MTHYDIALIGTGSGNSVITEEFADRRVAILERQFFGGTCLNVGCIPTKMFVVPADLQRSAASGPRLGVDTRSGATDWPAIRDRIFGRIDPIEASGRDYRKRLDNIDVYEGSCSFIAEKTIDTGTGTTITADQIVLAAGARPVLPDVPGLTADRTHTSDTIMRLPDLPDSMLIVGGGFIAAEFAHVFSSYGVQVTQVHRGPRLLSREDDAVSARFTELAGQQWNVRLSTTLERAEGSKMHLSGSETLEADLVLFATGRRPNTDQLGLVHTGVDIDQAGFVTVDDYQRTSVEGIWALGDICSPEMLKHVANQDARVVRHNLLHPENLIRTDHRFVPSAVFTSPQIATVGMTEKAAVQAGIDVVTASRDYSDVAYGWALEDQGHFIKLVADKTADRLVGAHLIGPQASTLIQPLIQAMSFDQPVTGLARGQYWIHPALTELLENALLSLEDQFCL